MAIGYFALISLLFYVGLQVLSYIGVPVPGVLLAIPGIFFIILTLLGR